MEMKNSEIQGGTSCGMRDGAVGGMSDETSGGPSGRTAVVLLASYNGEKYIGEQLDSILRQTYPHVEIYVRDDGSTDGTREILKKYEAAHASLHVVESEENLGYPQCFYALTDLMPKGDYFFFCDQDDVWHKEKIERAVEMLEKEPEDIPAAYYAGYHICDENLNITGESPKYTRAITFKDTLFEVCGLEFTMAVNRAAMFFLKDHKPTRAKARGTWMSMLYSAFGKVICDNRPCALYRRSSSSVTSQDMSFLGLWLWRIKKFFGGGFDSYRILLEDFYETMGSALSENDRKTLQIFAEKGYLRHVLQKVFYPARLRRKLFDEITLRFVFLIGKL